MNNEQKFWLIMFNSIFATVAFIVVSASLISNHHNQKMSKLGFEKQTIVGYSALVWQKIEE